MAGLAVDELNERLDQIELECGLLLATAASATHGSWIVANHTCRESDNGSPAN